MRAAELFEREPDAIRRSGSGRSIDYDFLVGQKDEHTKVFVTVSCSYRLGGYNYWNGNIDARGYRTGVGVETEENRQSGFIARGFQLGTGVGGIFPQPAARFGRKAMEEYAPKGLAAVRALADHEQIQRQVDDAVEKVEQGVAA